jgi:hypothetical protein
MDSMAERDVEMNEKHTAGNLADILLRTER